MARLVPPLPLAGFALAVLLVLAGAFISHGYMAAIRESTQLLERQRQALEWLNAADAESLLDVIPSANIAPDQATDFVRKVTDSFDLLLQRLEQYKQERAAELLDAHRRVRAAAHAKCISYDVNAELPPDVLGIYVYLPA